MPQFLVDATAGFGEDSLILAAAGFQVRLYEFDEIIAALLQDCMERAAEIPELKDAVGRMELICGDSVAGMQNLDYKPDIVLLDPMFPARQKSALIKKKFQLIQRLESPCSTEIELLNAAEAAEPKRIVIKRPLKGPYLADRKPSYSLEGKAIRYDCMVYAR
jgi:16S rRNA (guanine1516-N2)-methyltransferase